MPYSAFSIKQIQALAATALLGLGLIGWPLLASATSAEPTFQPRAVFAPFAMPDPVNRYRSADGTPGPDYWQNRADYKINARLDPQARTLSADETITYTNHSPDALHTLWLQMPQNSYRDDARANFSGGPMPRPDEHTQGFQLAQVQIVRDGQTRTIAPLISDTRMRVPLAQPLAADGGQVTLHIRYHYTIPDARFGGRTSWSQSKNGPIFEVAQWYPRMAVYDDIRGWNTDPFLNNEFYSEYGNFDYRVTAPAGLLVVGSGTLENPQSVLSDSERQALARARDSDKTVMLRSAKDVAAAADQPASDQDKTWHFHMNHTRDVAFAASGAFIWDAARLNIEDHDADDEHKGGLAMSVYPVEAAGHDAWGRSTEYLKHTTENFSRRWASYPYRNALAVAGAVGGMEYPGAVFNSRKAVGKDLFMITAHEIGHTWFPMLVGSNERRHAWMDEGMNTFIDVYAHEHFNHGEYAPKRDAEFAPDGGNPVDEIVPIIADPDSPPIMTRADLIPEKYRHPITYFKAALGFKLLREQILGPKRFDAAFKQYIADWSFKHPTPSDFFRAMDSAAGEDLSWFWRGWFAHNWALDLAVIDIQPINGDFAKGAAITVANKDRLVMPATLRLSYADGSHRDVRVPVATWMQHHHFTVRVKGSKPVVAAEIDPDHKIPDSNRDNNRFAGGASAQAAKSH